MGSQATMDALLELRKIYNGYHNTDKGAMTRLAKVSELLDVADLVDKSDDTSVCRGQDFEKINKMIDYYQPYQVNVIPYLQDQRSKLFEKCGDDLAEQIRSMTASATAGDEEKKYDKEMDEIDELVDSLPNEPEQMNEERIREEFVLLMDKKKNIASIDQVARYGEGAKKWLTKQIQPYVSKICRFYHDKFRQFIDENRTLEIGADLLIKDKTIRKWIVYFKACNYLTDETNSLRPVADLQKEICELRHRRSRKDQDYFFDAQ